MTTEMTPTMLIILTAKKSENKLDRYEIFFIRQ
jgi:hypothetical protein